MNEITPYDHKVQYYETDKMGIVHHSNYIRWFEEARIDILSKAGFSYEDMEEQGVMIPVLEAHAVYKSMTRFGETVSIRTKVKQYNGVVMSLEYEVLDSQTQAIRCIGETKHCFLDLEGKVMSLRRSKPQIHRMLEGLSAIWQ